MVARSLTVLLVLTGLAGCQTAGQRITTAATITGQTRAVTPHLELPDACTAHMDRVVPKVGEKARWSQTRWEIVADARDRQADDCRAWGTDYNAGAR